MSSLNGEFPDPDSDDEFNDDMEVLRSIFPGGRPLTIAAGGIASEGGSSEGESEGEGNDDLQLVRSIKKRFAIPMDKGDAEPLCTLPPDWSDSDEDDYETLRVIQRRFATYNDGGLKDKFEDVLHIPEQVGATIIDSEKETSNSFVERTNAREGFLNCVDTSEPTGNKLEACDHAGGSSDLGAGDVSGLPLKISHFPKSALFEAIKKNRSCQNLIRLKMIKMEARMEELGKLIERVRILKDFQVACRKRTGRALSQKKDPRVQLISVAKLRANMKPNEKNIPASYKGPPENVHVSDYKEALATFAIPSNKEKWSKQERENLVMGVKQQFQEMLVLDKLSEADGSHGSTNVDSIMKSIKDLDITPERMRKFSPKVDWVKLAKSYVPRRAGAECKARFLNSEDLSINQGPWTTVEDKNLLHVIQEKGLSNWIDIAALLGTYRTPFQCLARYQRSLNASILKREWTSEDDNQLRAAVENYGESNWQVVASTMEGRTGTQCSNRWLKTLHPARVRSGKWTLEEDKRLKVAATLFGPKTWKKVARCVPGRTHVQCRERWVNCLDPSLNKAEWTEEEDLKLEEAIAKHGYCWSKVAACIPNRTDNLCWRRWKVLFPTDVPLLQTARKIQKAALISNFVDRESERPALGPNDFRVPDAYRITGSENVDPSLNKKKISRRRKAHQHNEKDALSSDLRLTDGNDLEMEGKSMHNEGRRRSSRLTKSNAGPLSDTHLSVDMSHAGNSMKKSRPRKKIPGIDAVTTSVAVTRDEACSKEYERSDPTKEPTPADLNLQAVPLDAELGGDNVIIQCAKASKLQRRRRKTVKEVQELKSKGPSIDAVTTSIAVTRDEACSEEYERSDATKEPTPADLDLQEVPLDAELGGDNVIIQCAKASKLQQRRRKTLKEVQEPKSKGPRQAATKRKTKKDKKAEDATNDHQSSFSDSMCLVDVSATEATSGIEDMNTETKSKVPRQPMTKRKAKKDKKPEDATNDHQSSFFDSICLMDVISRATKATSGIEDMNMENIEGNTRRMRHCSLGSLHLVEVAHNQYFSSDNDNAVSGRDTDMQRKENDAALDTEGYNMTLASFLEQSRADTNCPSPINLGNSPRKRKRNFQIHVGSSNAAASKRQKTGDGMCSKQMIVVEEGSRNDNVSCHNEALDVEVGDDVTLAQFCRKYRKLKRRKTEDLKIQR